MKLLSALVIGIFVPLSAYASCITGIMLEVFPAGPAIKQNAVFVLSGTDQGQDVIVGLNKKHNIYLKSGPLKVRLLVVETYVSGGNQIQALLKPETTLKPGAEYQLCIDNLPENATRRYTEGGPLPVTYRVLAEKDTKAPKVAEKPRELGKILIYAGCGPISYVVFSNPAKDDSEVIVRTTVVALKTGRKTTYYLEPYGRQRELIRVGAGMCAGAFTFNEGDDYEAEFSFMDYSGNSTVWKGERIKFTRPDTEGGLEYE